MDWIEQLTGWNPDGGNGSFEVAVTMIVFLVAILTTLTLVHFVRCS